MGRLLCFFIWNTNHEETPRWSIPKLFSGAGWNRTTDSPVFSRKLYRWATAPYFYVVTVGLEPTSFLRTQRIRLVAKPFTHVTILGDKRDLNSKQLVWSTNVDASSRLSPFKELLVDVGGVGPLNLTTWTGPATNRLFTPKMIFLLELTYWFGQCSKNIKSLKTEWRIPESNWWPSACKADALANWANPPKRKNPEIFIPRFFFWFFNVVMHHHQYHYKQLGT